MTQRYRGVDGARCAQHGDKVVYAPRATFGRGREGIRSGEPHYHRLSRGNFEGCAENVRMQTHGLNKPAPRRPDANGASGA